ncbi:hypothetical protein [Spirulina major]|uniref:hypothetical protein n=1 Tax=Spirulina major TaxID=270636 RepID=UPI0009320D96|nr:hypothetical protein [Spirulina major]
MGKNLVNMTLLFVQDDIEHILATQSECIQHYFQQHDLIPELLAYVLSRIPNVYAVFDEGQNPPHLSHINYESAERQLQRENVIMRGIHAVFEKRSHAMLAKAEKLQNHISQSHLKFQFQENNPPRS